MKIKILGTRGEISASLPRHAKHSGVLINGELLFDVGEKEFLGYKPSWIFVTHLHPDHAFFVKEEVKIEVPVFAPEKSKKNDWIVVISKPIKLGGYKIIPVPTIHSLKVKSQGYILESRNKKIFYTGDLISIDKKYFRLISGLDLVITEASFIRKGGMVRRDKKNAQLYGHSGIPDIIELFKPFTKTILLTHFGSWFYRKKDAENKLGKLADTNKIKVIVAFDGMTFLI